MLWFHMFYEKKNYKNDHHPTFSTVEKQIIYK